MNRLGTESSSYLKSAAHQPIDWFAWGPEAFAKAKAENKPMLLDVGAVWCHWCHVMDRESYDSPEIAKLLNEKFVCVKVDRDERPDVDARYQRAVSALTGQGGWPLTAFLTPAGEVFFGGTYFPPTDAYGRMSFAKTLEAVADAFANRRDEVDKNAAAIREHLAAHVEAHVDPHVVSHVAGGLDASILADGLEAIEGDFDAANGGWGNAPKFPHPGAMEFLLATLARKRARSEAASALTDVARTTLDAMGAGGVYDHVGGGFHRYATDATWTVPHFEKMLYDNAELLRNYAHASALFGDDALAAKARDIWRFLAETLSDRERGGFFGSQDADVDATDDGNFFTWTRDELAAAIPDTTTARIVALRYNVEKTGEMHHDAARNVLFEDAEPAAIADALNLPREEVERRLAEGLTALAAARAQRPAPFVDPTLYVNWNGMAISAALAFAEATGDAAPRTFALRSLDRLLAEAFDAERGFAHTAPPKTWGHVDDNAQMLQALLDAWNATSDARYRDAATRVGDLLLSRFTHPRGGFADIAPGLVGPATLSPLGEPERPATDNPSPSANAIAALSLLRLSDATGDAKYGEAARRALAAVAPEARRYGVFAGAFFLAADVALHGPVKIVVAGPAGVARDGLLSAARRAFVPGKTVLAAESSEREPNEEVRAFLDGPARAQAAALVCVGTRCLAPAHDTRELAVRLSEALS